MSTPRPFRFSVAAFAAALILSSCAGTTPVATTEAEPAEVAESTETAETSEVAETSEAAEPTEVAETSEEAEPRPERVSEQDIGEARAALDSARADWENSGIVDYTLDVGLQSVGQVSVIVTNGVPGAEEVDVTDIDDAWFKEQILPKTVEGLFDEVDQFISELEADPSLVPGVDECGLHFNASFDTELGYPTYYDGLGPCADGVGTTADVFPFDTTQEAAVVDE